jgi:hypothetical protein
MSDDLVKLREALETVRKCFDDGVDDWQYRALTTFRHYLSAIGMERRLIDPIEAMALQSADAVLLARKRSEGATGTPKASGEKLALAYAAAAVTTLKDKHRMKLPDALEAVSKASGIDKSTIKNLRDNLSRDAGNKRPSRRRPNAKPPKQRVPTGMQESVDAVMAELRGLNYSKDEILSAVSGIGKFVG